ncbi:MAG: hypothetical protein E7172_05080 [Firmicutes bacterium]|nr:hypothetical protein [Bacillota bacterium]
MKNAILFYYGIDVPNDKIKKLNDNYYFTFQESNCLVAKYERNILEANELFQLSEEMISQNIPIYKIVATIDKSIVFTFGDTNYILMIMPKIKNRIITYKDIINFNYVPDDKKYKMLDKSSWNIFWANKIDYIEYQFSQIEKKYSFLKESINFYIGIWENAISYYNTNIIGEKGNKCVCHKRINAKTDMLSFLNPLNLIIDYKERDISEYIKSYIMNEKYTNNDIYLFLNYIPKERNSVLRFIARTLFPSNYFDLYEEIISCTMNEDDIVKVITNKKNYLTLLKIVFNYYENQNVPQIEWIGKIDN